MKFLISFVKIIFLRSIVYQNCVTDDVQDCKYTDFQIIGTSGSTLDRCGSDLKNLYMGPYGQQSIVTTTIKNIPPNKQVEFSVGIWKFDSWDREGFEIWANNIQIENLSLQDTDGTKICRNTWEDLLQPLSLKFTIIGTDLTIKLKDNLDQNLFDESWGFRDFTLRLSVPCVNFYSECNYSGTLFQICQGEQTKKATSIPYEIKSILMGPNIIVKIKDPNYFGGVLIEFSSSLPCMGSYKFPKYVHP